MSRYIGFVLERASAPQPRKVWILRHKLEWVNQQIRDEFNFLFPEVETYVEDAVVAPEADLVVIPYMMSFFDEYPGGSRLCSNLASVNGLWVMLYGVRRRVIHVMPASELPAFYWRGRFIGLLARLLKRSGFVRVSRRLCRVVAARL